MIEDEEGAMETMLSYARSVSMIRFVDNSLLSTIFDLEFNLNVADDADEDDICFALEKFDYWIENFVTGALIVQFSNDAAFSMIMQDNTIVVGNPLMITPEPPMDGHMLALIASKLNAFASGSFVVDIAHISQSGGGLANTIMGDVSATLPAMHQWVKEPNWFDRPWWDRNDASMIDSQAAPDTDLKVIPSWAPTLDFIREPVEHETIIIPGDFQPKII